MNLRLKNLVRAFKEKKYELFDQLFLNIKFYGSPLNYKTSIPNKRIVFAGQQLTHRMIKIIQWLKMYSNFEIIVVCQDSSQRKDLFPENYDHLVLFRNRTHLKRIILGAKYIDILYAFSSNPKHAAIAIESSSSFKIFDPYDCSIIYFGKQAVSKSQQIYVDQEKKCFQLADATVARSLENNAAYFIYGLKKKKNIFFSDYCDNTLFINNDISLDKNSDEITIVYAGFLKGKALNQISDGMTDFTSFIEAMEAQKIHFHIYPSPFAKRLDYADYIDMESKFKYFHIHSTVSQANLPRELSKYHFGALPQFKTENSTLSDYKIERATALKLFNFLEAGMPILISDEWKYMAWIVKRYNIGIVFGKKDFNDLRNKILSADYLKMKKNVLSIREKLSMKKNIPRLIQFLMSA